MNYIKQINNFWTFYDENKSKINTSDITLYFVLLRYCNKLNWLNPFNVNPFLMSEINPLSNNTYYKSLERLNELKLISWNKGKNNVSNAKITILKIKSSINTCVDNSIKFSPTTSTTTSIGTNNINNINNINNKTIKRENEENFLSPIEIIKSNLEYWESFQMKNRKQIKDWDKFILDWECKVDIENLNYNFKILKARLEVFCRNWLQNQNSFNKKQKIETPTFATNRPTPIF